MANSWLPSRFITRWQLKFKSIRKKNDGLFYVVAKAAAVTTRFTVWKFFYHFRIFVKSILLFFYNPGRIVSQNNKLYNRKILYFSHCVWVVDAFSEPLFCYWEPFFSRVRENIWEGNGESKWIKFQKHPLVSWSSLQKLLFRWKLLLPEDLISFFNKSFCQSDLEIQQS